MNQSLEIVTNVKTPAAEGEQSASTAILTPPTTVIDILKDPEAVRAIEALISTFVTRHGKNTLWERIFLSICFICLIVCVGTLSFFGKFDPSAGVILGAMAGYLFGKKDG